MTGFPKKTICRAIALLLGLVMVISIYSTAAFAVESTDIPKGMSLCAHNPVHTADCGYIEPTDVSLTADEEAIRALLKETNRVSPSNLKLNLFDYWVHDSREAVDGDESYRNQIFNTGINENHPLLFMLGNAPGIPWSTWTAGAPGLHQGIVQRKLDEDGYPQLNLNDSKWKGYGNFSQEQREESLAYLFQPRDGDAKKAFSDVKGLLRLDEETGTYSYSSHDRVNGGFAQFDEATNTFTVYDQIGGRHDNLYGQFFPFDSLTDFFTINPDGQTLGLVNVQGQGTREKINHHLGMSMEVEFYQPDGGEIELADGTKQSMQFEFAGDDDVWLFIDDVLVADLGGLHDPMGFTIDFSTGEITYRLVTVGQSGGTIIEDKTTSLREEFQKAGTSAENLENYFRKTGGESSERGTFRSGTSHTLKMFYLERGNQASDLALSYNLIPPIADDIVKIDQDNAPLSNVGFALYKANANYEITDDKPLFQFVTDENGSWTMADELGIPFNYRELYEEEGQQFYVLQETDQPEGYRKVQDIYLAYDEENDILTVNNTWDTGAVGNFSAKVYQLGGNITLEDGGELPSDEAQKGIILAVPMMKVRGEQGDAENWRPVYGANLEGFATADAETVNGDSVLTMRKRVLKATLFQLYASMTDPDLYQRWYLAWSNAEARYQGALYDLPGKPERYYHTPADTDADMAVSYYFVSGDVFRNGAGGSTADKLKYLEALVTDALGGNTGSSEQEYQELLDKAVDQVADSLLNDFKRVNQNNFQRIYGSHIYIPNALNTLSVLKVDENDEPLAGAEFGLYAGGANGAVPDDTAQPLVTGVTDAYGMLVFSANAENEIGRVKFALTAPGNAVGEPTYYLKEITAPEDYLPNDTWVPVYVTDAGVYADAGTAQDNVSVMSGLGTLLGTMHRYAEGGGVNITLRDLTLKGSENTKTEKGETELNVHYGLPHARFDYGTHEKIEGENRNVLPVFITEQGIAFGQVVQNREAHNNPSDEFYSTAYKEDLGEKELSRLFTGSTTVCVRNLPEVRTGSLTISKTVTGNAGNQSKAFTFTVALEDQSINGMYGGMKFTNGEANFTLKHGESKTASGIPSGTKYTVVEKEANTNGYTTTDSGNTAGVIVADTEIKVEFTNHSSVILPETGGGGSLPYMLGGILLVLVSAGVWLIDKRKFHSENNHKI